MSCFCLCIVHAWIDVLSFVFEGGKASDGIKQNHVAT